MKELIELIFTCTSTGKNWSTVLEELAKTFDQTSMCMFSFSENKENNSRFYWSSYFESFVEPHPARVLIEAGNDAQDGPGYAYLMASPPQVFYDEYTLFGVEEGATLPPSNIREAIEPLGFQTRSAAVLNRYGPWVDAIFAQHMSDTQRLTLQNDARLQVLLPVLANAQSLGRTLDALRARYDGALAMLDRLGVGVMLIDTAGHVISSNAEAQRILDDADGIAINAQGRLALDDPHETSRIQAMVTAASGLALGIASDTQDIASIRRPSGRFDYLITTQPIEDTASELQPGLRCVFATIVDPAGSNTLSASGLALLGGLTKAEEDIVTLLLRGLRPDAVARERDVSVNTVRVQLKAIKQKLRCATQVDIIRAAAATRTPMADLAL